MLRQVFNTHIFNNQNILNRIVFKYHFEDKNSYKRDLYITNMFIYISIVLILIILLFCTFIIFIEIYSIYNIEYIDKEILNSAYESLKNTNYKEINPGNKRVIFSSFIDLFNGNSYVPSKFLDKDSSELNVIKYLWNASQNVSEVNPSIVQKVNINLVLKIRERLDAQELLISDLMDMIHQISLENKVSFLE